MGKLRACVHVAEEIGGSGEEDGVGGAQTGIGEQLLHNDVAPGVSGQGTNVVRIPDGWEVRLPSCLNPLDRAAGGVPHL
jgi:hypothetical protein